MPIVKTAIDITAKPSKVWQVLTEFSAYQEWNPVFTSVVGDLKVGARLRVGIALPGGLALPIGPVLQVVKPNEELTWKGHAIIPGIIEGVHSFRIEARQGGCRFLHTEEFSGILSRLLVSKAVAALANTYDKINAALKARVESAA